MSKKNKLSLLLLVLIFQLNSFAQNEIFIEGKIISDIENLENIYIYNKRSNDFTLSNIDGFFSTLVRLNDTLIFSGIQFVEKKI